MTIGELLDTASQPAERLRWLVLKELGITPYSAEGRAIGDCDLLLMAAHMVLDRTEAGFESINPSFSEEKFSEAMKRG